MLVFSAQINLHDEDIKFSRNIFSLEAVFRIFKKGSSKSWALQFKNAAFKRKKCYFIFTWTINSGSLGMGGKIIFTACK